MNVCPHCEMQIKDDKKFKVHLKQRCGKLSKGKFNWGTTAKTPTKKQSKARVFAVVVKERRTLQTALEIERVNQQVKYVSATPEGIELKRMGAREFDTRYEIFIGYPSGRAAKLYVGVATHIGGSDGALAELEKLITVTKQEKEMAKRKVAAKKKVSKKKKRVKVKAATKIRKLRNSAAALYRKLLMKPQGRTDHQIFVEVRKTFKLGEDAANHCNFYRFQLRKAGKNPPKSKKTVKKKTVAKKKTDKKTAKKKITHPAATRQAA